jgi:excinuclease ABC subunit A
MGPEGGSGGGTVVTQGTPEQVAADPTSYTGQFLVGLVTPEEPAVAPVAIRRRRKAAAAG